MSPRVNFNFELQIGHVLFIDIVGHSKLLIDDQRKLQQQLNQIVRSMEQLRAAETAGKLMRLPHGDRMALVFFTSPEAPVQCALQISEVLQGNPRLKVRMGIHTGPVQCVTDGNDRSNIAGAGILGADRVVNIGDAGHILLSKRAAEDLAQYRRWEPYLHDLGEIEVKHGAKISIVNLYTDKIGNREVPEKLKQSSAISRLIDGFRNLQDSKSPFFDEWQRAQELAHAIRPFPLAGDNFEDEPDVVRNDREPELVATHEFGVERLDDPATTELMRVYAPGLLSMRRLFAKGVDLARLKWRDLEEIIADLLTFEGYQVQLGCGSKDGGIDVLAWKLLPYIGLLRTVWQAKHLKEGNKVGLNTIRELADTRDKAHATKGIIVTTGFLTAGALGRVRQDEFCLGKMERPELERWIKRVLQRAK